MDGKKHRVKAAEAWALANRQHGVITRAQLLELGLSRHAIAHRIARGRLHPLWRGVYAVGRPTVSPRGRWMAAVLSCGPEALLSHRSAASLWALIDPVEEIDVVVPAALVRRRQGVNVHRRTSHSFDQRRLVAGIPVTDAVTTLVDFASYASRAQVLRAVNQADRRGLIDAHLLDPATERLGRRPGRASLRALLDQQGSAFADSLLELRFLRLVRAAGLSDPQSQVQVNGFRVDFYWPKLGLVVETDGPRDHRTPAQQSRDRLRDQTHAAAGLTTLRFSEAQVRHEPNRVRATLVAVASRLRAQAGLRAESSRL